MANRNCLFLGTMNDTVPLIEQMMLHQGEPFVVIDPHGRNYYQNLMPELKNSGYRVLDFSMKIKASGYSYSFNPIAFLDPEGFDCGDFALTMVYTLFDMETMENKKCSKIHIKILESCLCYLISNANTVYEKTLYGLSKMFDDLFQEDYLALAKEMPSFGLLSDWLLEITDNPVLKHNAQSALSIAKASAHTRAGESSSPGYISMGVSQEKVCEMWINCIENLYMQVKLFQNPRFREISTYTNIDFRIRPDSPLALFCTGTSAEECILYESLYHTLYNENHTERFPEEVKLYFTRDKITEKGPAFIRPLAGSWPFGWASICVEDSEIKHLSTYFKGIKDHKYNISTTVYLGGSKHKTTLDFVYRLSQEHPSFRQLIEKLTNDTCVFIEPSSWDLFPGIQKKVVRKCDIVNRLFPDI